MRTVYLLKAIALGILLCPTYLQAQKPAATQAGRTTVRPEAIAPLEWPVSVPAADERFSEETDLQLRTHPNQLRKAALMPRSVIVHATDANGLPTYISGAAAAWKFEAGAPAIELAYSYLRELAPVLRNSSVDHNFRPQRSDKDELGLEHIRFRQYYKDIEVYGAELIVHLKDRKPQSLNGRFRPEWADMDATPALGREAALATARQDVQVRTRIRLFSAAERAWMQGQEQFSAQLVWYCPTADRHDDVRLSWWVTIYPHFGDKWEYFVDARSGEIIKQIRQVCSLHGALDVAYEHGAAPVTDLAPEPAASPAAQLVMDGPRTASGLDLLNVTRSFNTYQVGNTYYMADASREMFQQNTAPSMPDGGEGIILTLNAQNTSVFSNNFNPVYITSNNNQWNNKTAVSAHFGAEYCYSYFKSKFNRNAINGSGGNIISFINVSDEDGSSLDNAYWLDRFMFHGNGGTLAIRPFAAALDVNGHEVTHGVIANSAGLIYQDESGALNESFADIFGAMIERQNWKMGEAIANPALFPTGAFRDLSNPNNGGTSFSQFYYQPERYEKRYTGTEDNGGVHINSGINNFAYYKYAQRVGMDKAEATYYRALTVYLTKSSQFIDCRNAVIKAATDLFGAQSSEVQAVGLSYDEVGVFGGSGNNFQHDLPINPGSDFIVLSDNNLSQIYLANGTGALVANPLSSTAPVSKISVTDNGQYMVFIGSDKRMRLITINYNTGQTSEQIIQNDPIWRNVAVSKDGNRLAALTSDMDNSVYIFDLVSGNFRVYTLYNYTTAPGSPPLDNVLFADAIEFDYSGEYLMYDALNKISAQQQNWDISFLKVWDNRSRNFGDGSLIKWIDGLEPTESIGNPSFSKISPYIIAFDYFIESQDAYYVLSSNLETGDIGLLFENSTLGFPSFSRDDRTVIFDAYSGFTPVLARQQLKTSKLEPEGAAQVFINFGKWGIWYGNGTRNLNTGTDDPATANAAIQIAPNPAGATLTLSWDPLLNGGRLTEVVISDMQGRPARTYRMQAAADSGTTTVGLQDLPGGIWILTARFEQAVAHKIFIKSE